MKNKNINSNFGRRAVFCFFIILLLFLSCIMRLTIIAMGNYEQLQLQQSNYKIDIAPLRGTIYDCNMVPITNLYEQTIAAVSPTDRGIANISKFLDGDTLEIKVKQLKENKPIICNIEEEINLEGVAVTKIFKRYSDNLACHLIGYTDSTGHGVSGLELAYDELLYSDKKVSAVFACDGKGQILKGVEPYFENDLSVIYDGIVTTIDVNIQRIVEKIACKINSGCIIVADAKNSKIRAMASVPTFDVNDLSKSLELDTSPLINRALCTFNIGSIFKPCVAISAIEKGQNNATFNCEGSLVVGDRKFKCHNIKGHGEMTLCKSLAQSCNCFFYNYSITHGGYDIYKNASKLSFGSKIKIADNLYSVAGKLPHIKSLTNIGVLANFSIGQGELLTSPVAMLNLYISIANDGCYYIPSVVEKTVQNGVETSYDFGGATRVMSAETAAVLREYLKTVVTDGTGTDAAPVRVTAAGKTATAQTGRFYKDGSEITNSWFCGFFPADNPEYVVVVMSDSKQNFSTASIFAQIADEISEYKGKIVENNG